MKILSRKIEIFVDHLNDFSTQTPEIEGIEKFIK